MRSTLQHLSKLDNALTAQTRLKINQSIWWRPAVFLAHSGDSWLWAFGTALLWLVSGTYWRGFAAVLLISIVFQALFVFAIKQIFRRKRPTGEWGSIYRQYDPHSFPSGHATRAVLLAVMAVGLGPAWFGILISLWAPLVCLSRVLTGMHYISDILGGMILGLAMGLLMVAISPIWPQLFPFLF
jgi:membrane-associated phospholipid phosphatase